MFVIRKSWRWIDSTPCWVVYLDGTVRVDSYEKIVFDTFEEVVKWLNTIDARRTWISYHGPESNSRVKWSYANVY
jgi:hypothetical protein